MGGKRGCEKQSGDFGVGFVDLAAHNSFLSPKLPLPTLRLAELGAGVVLGLDRRKGIRKDTGAPLCMHTATPLSVPEWVRLHETARVRLGKTRAQATSRAPRARPINITGVSLSRAHFKSPPLFIHTGQPTQQLCANQSYSRRIRQRCMIQDQVRTNTLDSTD